ncbi:MAG: rhomboid family intramembrane serine protease [Bacteroidales bacterium]|nr:rhomboid family intramembrane serine protease [Bacteroidaceae bacterium]MBR2161887.1 rhomboid family intramembrane serine protease [Bacteroidaceae bacterium]MBR3014404.1 rhomboid family intramembrane serine protease [Bacteroidaceae bacterium]MBR3625418.1 rhomboid family intramembrane serine protease [Bacteroidaceae bacterium]MDO4185805.1 rhomboid family intramembrane serine protease [Bacteroidales bacterium]
MDSTIIDNLKERFRQGSMLMQIIYINVGVFVLVSVVQIGFMLFRQDISALLRYAELPASVSRFCSQPWSILSYMFMHAGVLHLLFNMLWLYWFGMLFLQLFSAKHLRGLYVFGGICGGLLYMLAYNVFPLFIPMAGYSYLVGASASVLAIVAAVAYRQPDYPINLLFIGQLRLKYLALIVIGLDLLFINADNAGGHIAHLGGALAGLWFAWSLQKGNDLTKWINLFIDKATDLFQRKSAPKKPKMKVHYGGKRQEDYTYNAEKKAQSDEIDRILDKLKKSGYESLTAEEKKALFNASNRK